MALIDWFLNLFGPDRTLQIDAYIGELSAEVYYKELAIQAAINIISNTVARGEFLTYVKGKEVKGDNYYLFNVEPNQNKSSSKFWRDVIYKLIYQNECLVIQQNNMFYVVDDFNVEKYAFKENKYKNITVGDYKLYNSYLESEVFHFELHNEKIKTVIDGLYNSYAKLIEVSSLSYKRNKNVKGSLEVPVSYSQTEKGQEQVNDLLQNKFKKFFESESSSVLPITNGMKYTELNNMKNGASEGRGIRALIDDVFDFVAIALQVPPQILKGNVADTEKAFNNLLTFCIMPIAELLTDEINRKLYGKEKYLQRTYIKLDTSKIKAVDIKDIAGSLDILTRIGAFTVDDSLKALGMEPLETEWSKARWMTKNYERIDQRAKGDG